MKKLHAELFSSILLFFLILGGCLFFSFHARTSIEELRTMVLSTPTVEEFEKLRTDPAKVEELKDQTARFEEQLKKAGNRLAFFINYEYLHRTYTAASALSSAVSSDEDADYETAREALLEALQSVERLETLTWELFL